MTIEEGVSTATTKEEATTYTWGMELGFSVTGSVGFLGTGVEMTGSVGFNVG